MVLKLIVCLIDWLIDWAVAVYHMLGTQLSSP